MVQIEANKKTLTVLRVVSLNVVIERRGCRQNVGALYLTQF